MRCGQHQVQAANTTFTFCPPLKSLILECVAASESKPTFPRCSSTFLDVSGLP